MPHGEFVHPLFGIAYANFAGQYASGPAGPIDGKRSGGAARAMVRAATTAF